MSNNPEETPPRTWRRRDTQIKPFFAVGNTSTDVEKTRSRRVSSSALRKHLHGRGEDSWLILLDETDKETPPRTWRRLYYAALGQVEFGNTSTDVEKTHAHALRKVHVTKHLHGRGEDSKI